MLRCVALGTMFLTACTYYVDRDPPYAGVIQEESPEWARVTPEAGDPVVLYRPEVVSDSLVGRVPEGRLPIDEYRGIHLQDIVRLETQRHYVFIPILGAVAVFFVARAINNASP